MLHRHPASNLWAVILAGGVFACGDTTTTREPSAPEIGGPSFTPGSGFGGATIGRGNMGAFHIKNQKAGDYDVHLKSKDDTDLLVTNLAVAAGGHSGWHSHPGPVLVIVKTGAVTLYDVNDPSCTGRRYPAGTVFIEEGGVVHIARNEGTAELTMTASAFLPAGGPGRIDEAAPGNCPF